MRNVVFVAPFPLETSIRFSQALRQLHNIRLLGVFQEPPPQDAGFDDVVLIKNGLDAHQIAEGVDLLKRRYGPIHRITGVLEDIQSQLAAVREAFGVPGLSVASADRFRDKATMKDALRAAGLPCARHRILKSEEDGWSFARESGLPLVMKPLAGAGCRATWRIESPDDLRSALAATRPSPERPVLAEEFIRGDEYSFETLCIGGHPLFHSISRYFPGPLEVTRTPWIQWCVVLPREIGGPEFDAARAAGLRAVGALDMSSGLTHMEWFRRPDGSVAIGEIAARPPGANIVKLTGLAHDTDLYRAWARATVDEAFDGPWERKFSTGCAYLRGPGQGRVVSVDGLDEAQRAVGHLVVHTSLPKIGAPKRDTYEGDGYAIVRHPDTNVVKAALKTIVETVVVRYA